VSAALESSSPEPNVTQAVPFFGVTDMRASLRFYVDGLGFRLKVKWTPETPGRIRWCRLEIGSAALMLQEYAADAGHSARVPQPLGQGVSVCFMCKDALAIYRDALAKGLTPGRPFVGNRLWVVSLRDPDGYHVDFESATDVPEETEHDPAVHG
jgi:catechol 2,3-dioxygenase-like lactoylglutathione lyase family enzyme